MPPATTDIPDRNSTVLHVHIHMLLPRRPAMKPAQATEMSGQLCTKTLKSYSLMNVAFTTLPMSSLSDTQQTWADLSAPSDAYETLVG